MRSDSSLIKRPFRADLHSHTTCSDGTLTPKELVELALEVGLQGLSITDHDTLEAYETAVEEADRLGLSLLTGVEFSAQGQHESVHVLGYGFDLECAFLRQFCAQRAADREQRNRETLEKLTQLGMPVTQDEVVSVAGIREKKIFGRPHIAQVMKKKGYVATVREAFDKWLGEGKPGYVAGREIGVEETITVLHKAGGKAVIAHPHHLHHKQTVAALLQMDFDGVEGYYGTMPPRRERVWVERGRRHGWIVTGGSDFHGANKPHIPLGASWVDEETFHRLREGG